jgi:hypothetical protein
MGERAIFKQKTLKKVRKPLHISNVSQRDGSFVTSGGDVM